jgi:hypothetical protein
VGINGNNDGPPPTGATTYDARRMWNTAREASTYTQPNPSATLLKNAKFGTWCFNLNLQGAVIGNPNLTFANNTFTSTLPSFLQQKYMDTDKSYTVDFWFYVDNSATIPQGIIAEYRYYTCIDKTGANISAATAQWQINVLKNTANTATFFITLKSELAVVSASGGIAGYSAYNINPTALAAATWHHVAITYDKDTREMNLYVNGEKSKFPFKLGTPAVKRNGLSLFLGGQMTTGFWTTLNGYTGWQTNPTALISKNFVDIGGPCRMDEFRISQDVMYTGPFTPPTTSAKNDLGPPAV